MRARVARDDAQRTWRTLWADEDAARLPAAVAELGASLLFGAAPSLVVRRAEALAAADDERILAALPRLSRPAEIVLVARAADQRRKLVQQLARAQAAIAFPRTGDVGVARRWVARLARERGQELAPAAVERLVERHAGDLAQLASELEKAMLYAGDGARVELAHVDATGTVGRGAAVEELTDRLGRGDLAGASRALRGLLTAGEPPVRIAAFLSANLRRVLHVAELADAGLDADAIAARLGMPAWLVRKQLGRGRARALEGALLELRQLDLALKSSQPEAAVFEAALLRIATTAAR